MQTVLAGAVPEGARTRYMAVFNLNVRGGMVIAALSLSAGAVVPSWGMAVVYGLIGLCACALYWSLLSGGRGAFAPAPAVAKGDRPEWETSRESEGAMS
jgi:DHA1 family multidrug resistance protein B-like MFS transporter